MSCYVKRSGLYVRGGILPEMFFFLYSQQSSPSGFVCLWFLFSRKHSFRFPTKEAPNFRSHRTLKDAL